MSYSSIVNNPECRSFVSRGFLIATDRANTSSFTSNFEKLADESWEAEYRSPFFELPFVQESVAEAPEYELFRCAFALGYSVGQLDFWMREALQVTGINDLKLVERSDQWLVSGPVMLLRPAKDVLGPLDPHILLTSSVCKGYLGGVSVADQLLAVGVH